MALKRERGGAFKSLAGLMRPGAARAARAAATEALSRIASIEAFDRAYCSRLAQSVADPYQFITPRDQPRVDEFALRLAAPGRFGNYVLQLINMIHVAQAIGAGAISAFDSEVLRLKGRGSIHGLHFGVAEPGLMASKTLAGSYFDRSIFGPQIMGGLTPDRQIFIARTYIRPLLEVDRPESEPGDEDLVINLRAGDIFDARNFTNWAPGTGVEDYPQPPLSFYTALLERQSGGRPRSVWITAENAANPVTSPLLAYLSERHIPVTVRIGHSLKSDLGLLLAARNLVLANGTFGLAIAMLSRQAKRVFHFSRHTSTRSPIEEYVARDIELHIACPAPGAYIDIGDWRNNAKQRALMLEFTPEALTWKKGDADRVSGGFPSAHTSLD